MTILTIDRFLVFYLNMRYPISWPPEKLLKYLVFIYVISFFIWGCFVRFIVFKRIEWIQVYQIMFIPYFIWDMIYIIQEQTKFVPLFDLFVYERTNK